MKAVLPVLFITCSAFALLFAISFVWASLRALFGGPHELYLEQSEAVRKRAELLVEKEAVLRSLKDLEFERDVGKLSQEDFKRLDAEFRARAKRILKLLEDDLREHREKAQKLIAAELAKAPGKSAKAPGKSAKETA
jgi:hypothetical protein